MNHVLYISYLLRMLSFIYDLTADRRRKLDKHNQFKFDFSFYDLLLIQTSSTIVGGNQPFTNKSTLV